MTHLSLHKVRISSVFSVAMGNSCVLEICPFSNEWKSNGQPSQTLDNNTANNDNSLSTHTNKPLVVSLCSMTGLRMVKTV